MNHHENYHWLIYWPSKQSKKPWTRILSTQSLSPCTSQMADTCFVPLLPQHVRKICHAYAMPAGKGIYDSVILYWQKNRSILNIQRYSKYIWLVYLPLWKIWKSNGMIVPNIWTVIKAMFQTTNQINMYVYIYYILYICLHTYITSPQCEASSSVDILDKSNPNVAGSPPGRLGHWGPFESLKPFGNLSSEGNIYGKPLWR